MDIKISSKWLNKRFNCNIDSIINSCKGRCCEGSNKILISLLPNEVALQEKAGYKTKDGLLLADVHTGKCPHKQPNGLCLAHNTALKPFGCNLSPFTLNKNNTLVIRHRYIMMPCYGAGEKAYKTFRYSLDLILGNKQASEISLMLDKGCGDIKATISEEIYNNIVYLDSLKHIN